MPPSCVKSRPVTLGMDGGPLEADEEVPCTDTQLQRRGARLRPRSLLHKGREQGYTAWTLQAGTRAKTSLEKRGAKGLLGAAPGVLAVAPCASQTQSVSRHYYVPALQVVASKLGKKENHPSFSFSQQQQRALGHSLLLSICSNTSTPV